MRISDWSSDVCSSDLIHVAVVGSRPDLQEIAAADRENAWVVAIASQHLFAKPEEAGFGSGIVLEDDRFLDLLEAPVQSAGAALATAQIARKSVVSGKGVSVRVDLGGSRIIKKT